MKYLQRLLPIFSIALFFSCKPVATALLRPLGKDGVSGDVKFVQEKNGKVFMSASVSAFAPGIRAIHIHEKGDCSAADGSSAGGHWNPQHHPHGKWGKGQFHSGDIGNVYINAQGKGFYALVTDKWCVKCNDPKKNILGKSVVIHEKQDDFTTQPTGAAGARKSCGVIRLK